MKRILLLITFTVMSVMAVFAYDVEIDGICYNLVKKHAVVTYYSEWDGSSNREHYTGEIVIPSTITYEGIIYPVTVIGKRAFWDSSEMTSVIIPNSITVIEVSAFSYCSGLTTVNIPNTITNIEGCTFCYCTGLTAVNIPNSVVSIGDCAFEDCTNLNSIIIPNSVTSIGERVFHGCTSLTSLNIPSSVSSIGGGICPNVESLTVENENSVYDSRDNCNAIINSKTNELIAGCKASIIPNSVTSIGNDAFYDCQGLNTINIPNTVTSIGNYAFYNCLGLEYINIPNSVSYLGYSAFLCCANLKEVNIPSSIKRIECGTFEGAGITSITIPNTVNYIDTYAFSNCTKLNEIVIPNSISCIYDYSFQNCTGLTSITIPSSVTEIKTGAFSGCKNIETVYCYAKSVPITYPDNLTDDGYGHMIDEWGNIFITPFENCYAEEAILYVPEKSVSSYQYCQPWSNFGKIIGIKVNLADGICGNNARWTLSDEEELTISGTGDIYDYTKTNPAPWNEYLSSIKQVVIEDGITHIGDSTFVNCTEMESISIPQSVTSIGNSSFANCSKVQSYTLPDALESIGDSTFVGCSAITKILIPKTVTCIGAKAFDECEKLDTLIYNAKKASISSDKTKLSFPSNIKKVISGEEVDSIPAFFLYGCEELDSIAMNENLSIIGDSVFVNCSKVDSIAIPKTVTKIGDGFTRGSKSLVSITVDEENETYSSYEDALFTNDRKTLILCPEGYNKNLVIPTTVDSICSNALIGCSKLTGIKCKIKTPLALTSDIFADVDKDNSVLYAPYSALDLYKTAEYWKEFKTIYFIGATLVDGVAYINEKTEDDQAVFYKRTFNNTSWQGLYIPFSISYDDWSTDFDIARINDVHQYDYDEDGNIDETAIEIIMMKSGSTEPNTPYFIKAKEVGDKVISVIDATLYATEENSFDVSSWNTLFTFTGTYDTISGSTMYENGYYALGNGTLHQAESADNDLSPFRWYMSVTDRNGNKKNINDVKVFMLNDDGTLTDVKSLNSVNKIDDDAIYTLSGNSVNNMTKGFYIKNGKKVFVK